MRSGYYHVFKAYLKNALAYRMAMALDGLFLMISYLVMIFVWFAIYSFSGVKSINGITLSSMVIYFFVIGSLGILTWPETANAIESDMHGGEIASSLIRPIRYSFTVFVREIPKGFIFGFLGTMPIIVLLYFIVGAHFGAFVALAIIVEVVMAYLIINLMGFIIGSLSIYLTDIFGILNGLTWAFSILGGGIMPILLYPKILYEALMLTPFPFLYYVPAGTFTGMISASTLPALIAEGLVWIGILAVASVFLWKKVSRDINVVGV